ncbi:MAG: M3 family metallopeptidase [Novosphingobium sp.]
MSIAVLLAASSSISVSARQLPIDSFIKPIAVDAPDAATLKAVCDREIAEIERRQSELEAEKGPATQMRTLQRYDDIVNLIGAASGESTLYREVMADDARRQAGGDCEVRVSNAASKLSLSRPIYDRLKAIPTFGMNDATKLYLTRTLADFERAGVASDRAKRAQIQALQEQLSKASTDFDANIAKGRKTVTAVPAELEGLPADYIAAHKPGADGRVVISTDYPDLNPVMAYAKSEALRKRLTLANLTRAYPENDAVLRRMLDLRQQLATMLGRPNYAALILENKMLDSPDKVDKLLADMAAAARPAADRDYAKKLAALRLTQPDATKIEPWNNAYLGQQVQKSLYSYDRQEARRYFAYNDVRDGILALTQDLFGVKIRPWKTAVWDPSVEPYELLDHGQVIGRFYFDSHPRPGKYNHGNMVPLRNGIVGRSIPVAALVMNMPAGDHTTGLMEHGDVVTFLHEFGHMLHGMFSPARRWAGISGISTEWDFVEAPSQMLEEWVFDYDTLSRFARDAEGNPIPRELVARMNAARYFDLGLADMRQLALSNISLRLHQGPAPVDIGTEVKRLDAQYNLVPLMEGSQFQDAFGHLSNYSAVYYTYRWSKVIADDMFTQFAAKGLRDRSTAERYRRLVLQPGGSKPAAQMVSEFLGRPISLDAYKAEMARNK